jgi:hypothetical protein
LRGTIAAIRSNFAMTKIEVARNAAGLRICDAVLVALWLMLVVMPAAAADDERAPEPVYMTGAEVRIDKAVDSDLIAAAGRMHVAAPVAGDAILGAGSLDLNAAVGEDLRAAAGFVTITSRIRGETLIAAGRIVLAPGAELHGYSWLAGSHISLGGLVLASTKIYGRVVSIEGEIYGPLEIIADRVEIRGSARIFGDVSYSADREIAIDPAAQVSGTIKRTGHKASAHAADAPAVSLKWLRPFLLATLFAAGMLLYVLLPRFVRKSVQMLTSAPAKSVALGIALFFSVPPVIVLLFITIIGIPIGIFVAACHVLAVIAGYLISGFFIAEGFVRAFKRRRDARVWDVFFFASGTCFFSQPLWCYSRSLRTFPMQVRCCCCLPYRRGWARFCCRRSAGRPALGPDSPEMCGRRHDTVPARRQFSTSVTMA